MNKIYIYIGSISAIIGAVTFAYYNLSENKKETTLFSYHNINTYDRSYLK